eukprot:NODE_2643_length_1530_cov_24.123667_g2279_i0.p1 GENE.NODE_2643_length_1530_cov_24.123667_g2279_i0~~NODE_2643_length_1530_cov_24.123667_g2279_i0.p1  ORF type:complete len:455 (+),score=44.55 NODE_2643_length_1530_cov_24.123667_g2279_i0:86-1366(+)
MEDIPPIVWSHILAFLPLSCLLNIRLTCHLLRIQFENYFSGLLTFDIKDYGKISVEGINYLLKATHSLTEMDLTGSYRLCELTVTPESLVSISLAYCSKMTDQGLQSLASCYSLLSLNLTSCCDITDDGIIPILQNCTHLQHLDLTYCSSVTNKSFEILSQCCAHLNSFSAAYSPYIDDRTVALIAQNCLELQYLSLSRCPKVQDASLTSLGQYSSQLKGLSLAGCRFTKLGFVNLNCPLLSSLDVSELRGFGDVVVKSLVRNCNSQLINLDISECDLTNAAMSTIADSCPNLTCLIVSGCKKLSLEGFCTVAQQCTYLNSLDMSFCLLDGNDLYNLLGICTQLGSLDVSYCSRLTLDSVYAAVEQCIYLYRLDLNGLSNQTVSEVINQDGGLKKNHSFSIDKKVTFSEYVEVVTDDESGPEDIVN